MFDFIRSILSNPIYAFAFVISIWILLYFILSKIIKISEKWWTRLEFIWIFIGIFGVMTIVDENRKNYTRLELVILDYKIERDYDDILQHLSWDQNCRKYDHNIELHTKQEFDSLQNRQNSFCEWTKIAYVYVDSCRRSEEKIIGNMPVLTLKNEEEIYPYKQLMTLKSDINENVEKKMKDDKIVADSFWEDFKFSFGLLLAYFAFGLRLAITTNKLRNTSKKT